MTNIPVDEQVRIEALKAAVTSQPTSLDPVLVLDRAFMFETYIRQGHATVMARIAEVRQAAHERNRARAAHVDLMRDFK